MDKLQQLRDDLAALTADIERSEQVIYAQEAALLRLCRQARAGTVSLSLIGHMQEERHTMCQVLTLRRDEQASLEHQIFELELDCAEVLERVDQPTSRVAARCQTRPVRRTRRRDVSAHPTSPADGRRLTFAELVARDETLFAQPALAG